MSSRSWSYSGLACLRIQETSCSESTVMLPIDHLINKTGGKLLHINLKLSLIEFVLKLHRDVIYELSPMKQRFLIISSFVGDFIRRFAISLELS